MLEVNWHIDLVFLFDVKSVCLFEVLTLFAPCLLGRSSSSVVGAEAEFKITLQVRFLIFNIVLYRFLKAFISDICPSELLLVLQPTWWYAVNSTSMSIIWPSTYSSATMPRPYLGRRCSRWSAHPHQIKLKNPSSTNHKEELTSLPSRCLLDVAGQKDHHTFHTVLLIIILRNVNGITEEIHHLDLASPLLSCCLPKPPQLSSWSFTFSGVSNPYLGNLSRV